MTVGDELSALIQKMGEERALKIIQRTIRDDASAQSILTVVANQGSHHLPEMYLRGTIYVASTGNLDFSSIELVHEQYSEILSRLASVLQSQLWKRIYLIPFGHSTLAMQIKLLVYRITRIETVDLFYDGKGGYSDLQIELRPIIVASDASSSRAILFPLSVCRRSINFSHHRQRGCGERKARPGCGYGEF